MNPRIPICAAFLLVLFGTGIAQQSQVGAVVKLEPDYVKGHLVHHVDPVYPQMAKIAHVVGDVLLKVIIDKKGNVEKVTAVSGHPILIQSSIDAVKQWKYEPFKVGGGPVVVQTTVTVKYRL